MERSKLKKIDFPLARDCFACSPTNPISLKLEFYSDPDNDNQLYSFFTPTQQHVSWGNIIHGGISAAVLDELSAWVVIVSKQMLCVTSSFELKYHAPLLVGKPYIIKGEILHEKGKAVNVAAEILDEQHKKHVSSVAKLITLSHSRAKSMNIMNESELEAFMAFIKS